MAITRWAWNLQTAEYRFRTACKWYDKVTEKSEGAVYVYDKETGKPFCRAVFGGKVWVIIKFPTGYMVYLQGGPVWDGKWLKLQEVIDKLITEKKKT